MVGISGQKRRHEGLCSGDKKSAQAVNPCSRSDAESAQYRNKFRSCKGFFTPVFIGKCDCARAQPDTVSPKQDFAAAKPSRRNLATAVSVGSKIHGRERHLRDPSHSLRILNVFELLKKDPRTAARLGRLSTAHGAVETPAFIPVGTQGTVKAVTPRELRELKAQ